MSLRALAFLPALMTTSAVWAQFTSTTNRATWTTQVGADNISSWPMHPALLDQATEVLVRPIPGVILAPTLTFPAQSPPFTLRAMQTGAQLIYKDVGFTGSNPDFISIGKSELHEDDDLEIDLSAGCVRAVGIALYDNSAESGEQVRVYGEGGALVGTVTPIPGGNPFIGVAVASGRITRIEIDESATADDIGITELLIVDCTTPGSLITSTSISDWQARARRFGPVVPVEGVNFVPTPEAIAESVEIATPPAPNANLSNTLSFPDFEFPFSLRTLEAGSIWVYADVLFDNPDDTLSPGRADADEDDDFELVNDGPSNAIGAWIVDNTDGANTEETCEVYAESGALLGIFPMARGGNNANLFNGMIARVPIATVLFSEDAAGDDILVSALTFAPVAAAVPAFEAHCRGETVTLSLVATAAPTSFQWYLEGDELNDGPTGSGSTISGSSTGTLQIANATTDDTGTYTCVIATDAGVEVESTSAWMGVCITNYNCDTVVDILDFLDFIDDFSSCEQQPSPCGGFGNPDINGDTFVDILDFLDFIDAFSNGC